MELDNGWTMMDFNASWGLALGAQAVDFDDGGWLPARVPGDVHSSLLELGRLPDPFYGSNVEAAQWVETREWWFRKRFRAEPASGPDERVFLSFEGLDLFATVYLNGELLGEHANMFRPAAFEVAARLLEGQENVVAVRFDPLRLRVSKENLVVQMPYYDSNTRAHVRKAQAQFMWDHTPPCLNVGLWQGVTLSRHRSARLRSPHFRVLSLTPAEAVVGVDAEVERWGEGDLELEVALRPQPGVAGSAGSGVPRRSVVPVIGGQGSARLTVPDPALWWPTGLGEANLYDLEVSLKRGLEVLDTFTDAVGLRTVRVDRSPDPEEPGCENFTFVVNDVPVFIKGANWVPTDLLNGRVTETDYAEWFALLKEANGNMLRVWGGGQYEPDAFYRTADRTGILIWHDFMFACASYPDHLPAFVEEVRKEAEFQVVRLRNRPSLAIWVGNNENDWHLERILWQTPDVAFPGKKIGHELLPEVVGRLDPDCFYWPSSPYGGSDHNSDEVGDKHNWTTWHALGPRRFGEPPVGDVALEVGPEAVSYWHLGTDRGRFISEFGIHAAPVLETLRRNLPDAELAYDSPDLRFRNRNVIKDRGALMMQAHTGLPTSLEEYIDFSMMVQAEGLKHGIEHLRRRKFHCSGALFWQWNDNWPGITWSVLDYYRFPKAGYFFVKRAFAPITVSVKKREDGRYSIWGVNDTLAEVEDVLHWRYLTFSGVVRHEASTRVRLPANAACELLTLSGDTFRDANPAEAVLWLRAEHDSFPDNRFFFVELKDLQRQKPDLEVAYEPFEGGVNVRLETDRHAYFVNLFVASEGTRYSDNWFDICPGETREVRIWHDQQPISEEMIQLRWR